MKMFSAGIAALFISLTISGCNSNNTDKVKNGIMDFDKSITVSQAFDNWKSCTNGQWSEFTTDNGKNIVEFTCEPKEIDNYNKKAKLIYLKIISLEKETNEYGERDKAIDDKLKNKIFDISKSIYTVQWIINKDDTFNLQYIGLETTWHDGKKYEKGLKINSFLQKVYANSPYVSTKKLDDIDTEVMQLGKKYSHYLDDYKGALLKDMFSYYDYIKAE